MLNHLTEVVKALPELLKDPAIWDSLIVNRRKPVTYRAFTQVTSQGKSLRVCLHEFDTCASDEAFLHPHPWPGAFMLLGGSYRMRTAASVDRTSEPTIDGPTFVLHAPSSYEITSPLVWHSVEPLSKVARTIMVNGAPWAKDFAHTAVRTTAGKDLDKMTAEQLRELLGRFTQALEDLTYY